MTIKSTTKIENFNWELSKVIKKFFKQDKEGGLGH